MNTLFIPSPGVAFSAPSGGKHHLFFVLTLPLEKNGVEKVLIVNITSTRIDERYTLSPGDHPSIDRKSYINYPKAKIISVKELEQKRRRGRIKIKESVKPEILEPTFRTKKFLVSPIY